MRATRRQAAIRFCSASCCARWSPTPSSPDDANTDRVDTIAPGAIARTTLTRLHRLGADCTSLAFSVAILGRSAELRHAARLAALDLDAGGGRRGRPRHRRDPARRAPAGVQRSDRTYHDLRRARSLGGGRQATNGRRGCSPTTASRTSRSRRICSRPSPGGDPWVVERLRAAASGVLEHAPAAACTSTSSGHTASPQRPPIATRCCSHSVKQS